MKSRAARVVLLLVALAAQAAAGYKVWDLDRQAATERAAAESFDQQARQVVAGIAEMRAAQQSYVALGQGEEFWFQKVRNLLDAVGPRLAALRQAARTPEAITALETATESLTSFGQLDQRVRENVTSGQRLSASDMIFTDGMDITTRAAARVDAGRASEMERLGASIAGLRWMELYVLGGALAVTLIALIVLVPLPRTTAAGASADDVEAPGGGLGLSGRPAGAAPQVAPAPVPAVDRTGLNGLDAISLDAPEAHGVDLAGAARLCAALARVQDTPELPPLIGQAAIVLDAAGLIVWIADAPGGDLRPALAHGYASQVVARMGTIPVSADNATAAAFRTGTLQAVPGDDLANGALVVPLQSAGGITGAMAVEVRHGRETDENTRALASIIAAQLATLFTPAEDTPQPEVRP